MPTVISILFQVFKEEGITHLFGVPGGPLVPLQEGLERHPWMQSVLAKQEAGAAFMAEGYARVRRGLGVCYGTSGPGATNALTGIASANSDSIPVLLISGQVATSTFGKGALQDSSGGHRSLDIVDVFRSVTKRSVMLHNGQQAHHQIRSVLRAALTGRPGAVHLTIPADVMTQEVPDEQLAGPAYRSQDPRMAEGILIGRIAKRLREARHPVCLAGHGVNLAGGWEPLRKLAEQLDMPVATTLKGKGAFPEDHALSLGVFGLGGSPFSDAYVFSEKIDVILIIGTSLGEFQTHGWDPRLARNRTVIQIDVDPQEIGKNYPVDLSMVGDARAALEALTSLIARTAEQSMARPDNVLLMRLHLSHQRHYEAQALQGGESSPLKPQALVARLSEITPPETLLFVDNGNSLSWAGQYYVAREPGTVFMATNVASMGYAVAAAIGGKIAAPQRPVVALVGDAAFAMTGMEVHTAVEYGVPVIWIVLNNGGHGMVHVGEKLLRGRSGSTTFRTPLDVVSLAHGLGVKAAYQVETLVGFTRVFRQALQMQVPCVIDARVSLDEVPYGLQKRVQTLGTFFGQSEGGQEE